MNPRYTFLRFPEGKMKAVTFSYDDGVGQDIRLVALLDKYGLKGTFNINTLMLGLSYGSRRRLSADEVKEISTIKFDIKSNLVVAYDFEGATSENQLEDKKLNVEFDTDDFDMIAYADKDAINQVIYNVCHNAIKFSYEGGLYKVSIKYEGNNTIRFTLFNEGIGITSEELPFVFDRFYKSDKSRGLDKTGTGLGLFISKTIIDAHGQTIKVSSEYEKWCEFSFTVARNQKSLPKGENK
jgi:signal transduction histidine kinase